MPLRSWSRWVSLNIDSTSVLQGGPRKSWSPEGQGGPQPMVASAPGCSLPVIWEHILSCEVFFLPRIHKE